MSEYYHSHCSELSQKNKVKAALNSRYKITRTEICKIFVLYSTVQLFNSLFKVLGPGTKYRSPKLWILSLQVILAFVQAVLILPSTRSPQIAELVHPGFAHPLCQSLHSLSEPSEFLQVSSYFLVSTVFSPVQLKSHFYKLSLSTYFLNVPYLFGPCFVHTGVR